MLYSDEKDSTIVLEDDDAEDGSPTMECRFGDQRLWEKAVPGQVLVIRGKTPGFLSAAVAVECEVVKAETAVPEITATDLTAEFLADPAATREKYEKQWLICSGVVLTPLADTALKDHKTIVVETDADTKLSFRSYKKAFREELADLKEGDAIKVVGEYNTSVSPTDVEKGKPLELTTCLPLKP